MMKKNILVLSAFLALNGFLSAQGSLKPTIFTGHADENVYLIEGKKGLTLIDALRSGKTVNAITSAVANTGKKLHTVFITHGHPDHFQGLYEILRQNGHPQVFVASQVIKDNIKQYASYASANGLMEDVPNMKPKTASNLTGFDYDKTLEVLTDDKLFLDKKNYLNVMVFEEPGESVQAAILFDEKRQVLYSGDLIVNQVFPWLGPGVEASNIQNWQVQLREIDGLFADKEVIIYPGHGKPKGKALIGENLAYLRTFIPLMKRTKSKEDALGLFKELYPKYVGDFLLKRSIDQWFPKTRELNLISISHIQDLTHTLNSAFPYIPVPGITFPFSAEPIAQIKDIGVGANKWNIHEHIGTQIDAPNHFIAEGMALEDLEVRNLIVPMVVIDISAKAEKDVDAVLTPEDIYAWEAIHGAIPENACVMMYSGWEKVLHDAKYLGLDENHVKHFPGISLDAANVLIKERNISGVGVDVISFDPGYDSEYKTHKAVLGAGKWALEAVANLKKVPTKGGYLFVGAPKVEGGTGGITRILAVW